MLKNFDASGQDEEFSRNEKWRPFSWCCLTLLEVWLAGVVICPAHAKSKRERLITTVLRRGKK